MQMQNVEDVYPLSPMQEGLLFHSLYSPQSEVYFEQFSYTLRGSFDVPAFKQAWQRVVAHHPILRTLFVWENLETPLQVVRQQVELPWREQDWRHLPLNEQQQQMHAELHAERVQGFDLARAPLLRLRLMRLGEHLTNFTWNFHHLLLDGWSANTVLSQVFACYEASQRGQRFHLPASRPYRDYIAWLQQQDLAQTERFWRHTLRGFTNPTSLDVNQTSGSESEPEPDYREWKFHIPAAIMVALQALARREQLTLNTLIQGAWALLLSRYSGMSDVVFGVTVSGRPAALPGVEAMVGLFINTLPLRVQVEPRQRLLPWLQHLQAQQAEARQYEHSPLVQVQGWSDVPRGQPLFESLLVFENYPIDDSAIQESSLEIRNAGIVEWTNYPLTIVIAPQANMLVRISYMECRFEAATVRRMAEHFQTILESILSHPECQLATLPIMSASERQQMLIEWNATQAVYPLTQSVHTLFEEQAERTPDRIAVVFSDSSLSYGELNRRANALAHYLRQHGAGPATLVALCVDRSLHLLVALLGILKSGAAYVPLDPSYPAERLAFMLTDSQAPLLLTQQHLLSALPPTSIHRVCLDAQWSEMAHEPEDTPAHTVSGEELARATAGLAYVIYTSGSTGQPKGVQITHRALLNFLSAMLTQPGLQAHDTLLAVTSFSFDIAGLELYLPLLVGGRILLVGQEGARDGRHLADWLARGAATIMQATPATWRLLLEAGWQGDPHLRILCGGEALPPDLAHQLLARGAALWNLYGPTETTIWSLSQQVESVARAIPIGRPIANTQVYVLDAQWQLVPIGVAGDLYIGGAGLARGYLHRPDLTAQRFLPDPFSREPGQRLYHTGDRARYFPDGVLEFLGRSDQQIKLRGYRIELGEIEAVLRQHAGVRAAVVVLREDVVGDQRLVAYVVGEQEQVEANADELRRYLQQRLPEYMLPSHFVTLQALPLTPNGKVDRRALPAPDQLPSRRESGYEAPRTPVEEMLAPIWAQVLRQERVGVHDNFFELGGHSLLATQIMVRIRQVFQVEIPLRSLFRTPTVAGLAEQIEAAGQAKQGLRVPSIKRLPRPLN